MEKAISMLGVGKGISYSRNTSAHVRVFGAKYYYIILVKIIIVK